MSYDAQFPQDGCARFGYVSRPPRHDIMILDLAEEQGEFDLGGGHDVVELVRVAPVEYADDLSVSESAVVVCVGWCCVYVCVCVCVCTCVCVWYVCVC